jgi:hypothetical protein
MALTTPQDITTLDSWSWLRDYAANKTAFIDLARIIYQLFAKYAANPRPPLGPDDLEEPLTMAIRTSNIFKLLCVAKPHARPSLHAVFARLLAKYIIDCDWVTITRP